MQAANNKRNGAGGVREAVNNRIKGDGGDRGCQQHEQHGWGEGHRGC